jgi:hypothetical protein
MYHVSRESDVVRQDRRNDGSEHRIRRMMFGVEWDRSRCWEQPIAPIIR